MQPPLAASFCVSLHTDTVYLTLLVYDSYLLHVPPFCSLFIKLQVKVTYVYCTMSLHRWLPLIHTCKSYFDLTCYAAWLSHIYRHRNSLGQHVCSLVDLVLRPS